MSRRIIFPVAVLVATMTAAPARAQRPAVSCESLGMLSLPNTYRGSGSTDDPANYTCRDR